MPRGVRKVWPAGLDAQRRRWRRLLWRGCGMCLSAGSMARAAGGRARGRACACAMRARPSARAPRARARTCARSSMCARHARKGTRAWRSRAHAGAARASAPGRRALSRAGGARSAAHMRARAWGARAQAGCAHGPPTRAGRANTGARAGVARARAPRPPNGIAWCHALPQCCGQCGNAKHVWQQAGTSGRTAADSPAVDTDGSTEQPADRPADDRGAMVDRCR